EGEPHGARVSSRTGAGEPGRTSGSAARKGLDHGPGFYLRDQGIWRKNGSASTCLLASRAALPPGVVLRAEVSEDVRELRIAIVVFVIDLFTAFGQVMFQVPQIRRLLDIVGQLLRFLNHFVQLATQSSVEGCAGDGLFRSRPSRFVPLRVAVLVRRRAGHVPIL